MDDLFTNGVLVGETPRATSDWMTNAVESGSVMPGVADVLEKYDHPPSLSCPVSRKRSADVDTELVRAPWAASPWMANAVELVSGPAKLAGVPLQALLVLSGVVQPPSGHCAWTSHAIAVLT